MTLIECIETYCNLLYIGCSRKEAREMLEKFVDPEVILHIEKTTNDHGQLIRADGRIYIEGQ